MKSLIPLSWLLIGAFVFCRVDYAIAQNPANIVVIFSDDQHWADLEIPMPQTHARIFESGVTFENAFATTPWCCPSRATLYTGKFANKHGVIGNRFPLNEITIFNRLQSAGYLTGIIGKYLNSWDGEYRPEFDFWRSVKGGNVSYTKPRFNENGTWRKYNSHVVDVYKQYVDDFFEQVDRNDQPFILLLAPNIPHRPAVPEPKYAGLFEDDPLYIPENAGCGRAFRRRKPRWLRKARCDVQLITEPARGTIPFQVRQKQVLRSLDDIVGQILDAVESRELTDSTAVFYMSDNGLLRGSFGLIGKPFSYEDAIRVPFGFVYPPVTGSLEEKGEERIVGNIDIAPTIYDLAGLSTPAQVDGRSLVELLSEAPSDWRENILFEGYFTKVIGGIRRPSFAGIRSSQYSLIVSNRDLPELYDMEADPWQLKNVLFKEKEVARTLFEELRELRPDIIADKWVRRGSHKRVFGISDSKPLERRPRE